MTHKPLNPLPLLPLIVLSLLAALWAGLLRMGWQLPPIQPRLAGTHGALMVSGFLGTLIAVERAVALRQRAALSVPLLSGLGALALIVGLPLKVGAALLTFSSLGMVLISAEIMRRENALHTWTLLLGALAWFGGNALWLFGATVSSISYWWGGFLVLIIAGERLELSRVRRPPRWAKQMFALALAIFVAGLLLSTAAYGSGMRLASFGVVLLAVWLLTFDLARRNVRLTGLPRYIAANLLIGYGWLAISGLIGLAYSPLTSGLRYDAWLHALFLGFVIGMVFAHAPLILPAVTGFSLPFQPRFYLAPLLLHGSLVVRVAVDLLLLPEWRRWSGLFNEIAILLFFALVVRAIWTARHQGISNGSNA